jgi:hypothetical protein
MAAEIPAHRPGVFPNLPESTDSYRSLPSMPICDPQTRVPARSRGPGRVGAVTTNARRMRASTLRDSESSSTRPTGWGTHLLSSIIGRGYSDCPISPRRSEGFGSQPAPRQHSQSGALTGSRSMSCRRQITLSSSRMAHWPSLTVGPSFGSRSSPSRAR